MNNKVMVAMSGGVDSSVAALLVLRKGYEAAGVTMKLFSSTERVTDSFTGELTQDIEDAESVSALLGIEHFTVPLGDSFRKYVTDDFISVYKNGGTPNPCVLCNKYIKFGKLLDFAVASGYDRLATGHYAGIKRSADGRYLLCKAKDESKDQSYFLWTLTQKQLSRVLFPLGEYTKSEVRAIADENGFVSAHKSDSQDICFVPDGNYVGFIERESGLSFPCGNFVDTDGNVLGTHNGIISYTVGQRKGLGIALGKPAFVRDKDAVKNTVTLCSDAELYTRILTANCCNFSACDSLYSPTRLTVRIRYRHAGAAATVTQISPDSVRVEFDEAQRAPARGQSAVFYDGDTVVGGGVICG